MNKNERLSEILPGDSFPDGDRAYQYISNIFNGSGLSVSEKVLVLQNLVGKMIINGEYQERQGVEMIGYLGALTYSLSSADDGNITGAISDIDNVFFHERLNLYYREGFLLTFLSDMGKTGDLSVERSKTAIHDLEYVMDFSAEQRKLETA